MSFGEFGQFVLSFTLLLVAELLFSVLLLPADLYTQALVNLAILPMVFASSYGLAYSLGFKWL